MFQSSAHEEGGDRVYSVNTEEFMGRDGKVTGLRGHEVKMAGGKFEKLEETDFELEADLVLLAMGFVGPEREGLLSDLNVEITDRGNVARDANFATSVPGVFVAGDMGRGQSLIVWAIAEGRAAAAGADRYPSATPRYQRRSSPPRSLSAERRGDESPRHAPQWAEFASARGTVRAMDLDRRHFLVALSAVTVGARWA